MSSSLFLKNNFTFNDWSAWSDSARKFLFNDLSSHKDLRFEIYDSNRFHCQGFRLAVGNWLNYQCWRQLSISVSNRTNIIWKSLRECSSHTFHRDCLIQWATRDGDIPNKKTCPLCRKDFRHIKMQSNIGEQEVLVEVNQPVTYVRGAETLAPPATDQQDFPDWSVLRRNNVRQFPHTNYPNYGYPGW